MALPSFFKRKASPAPPAAPPAPSSDEAGPVQAARAQARRRLIGAVVLLAVGVVVFPMLFETQPRPLAKDIPIDLPRRDAAVPKAPAVPRTSPAVTELPVPEPTPPASSSPAAVAVVAEAPPHSEPAVPEKADRADKSQKTERADKAEKADKAPVTAPAKPTAPASTAASAAAPKVPPVAASAARPEPPRADIRKAESDRARAALEGRVDASPPAPAPASAPDAKAGRFVVQVGAYTDAATLREVRAKVEKLGLKTYTQSVDTEAGKRTRVRVGPFATRQEADSASNRLKGAGLPGNVLVL